MPLIESQPDALSHIYAQSLFELAELDGGQSRTEEILDELENILEITRSDHQFNEFLASRVLSIASRKASITNIFTGKVSDLTLRFLLVLNEKNRISHLVPIVAAYDALVQAQFGRIEVDVFTASPIGSTELNLIKDRLQKVLGKQPVVHPYTDEAMIGGIKMQIGDKLIDASIASRLRKLQQQIQNQGGDRLRSVAHKAIEKKDEQSD